MTGVVMAAGAAAGWPPGGLAAALLATDGISIRAFGPGTVRGWTAEERQALARPGRGRDEALELAMGTALAGLDGWSIAGLLAPPEAAVEGGLLAEALGRPVAFDFDAADRRFGGMGGAEDAFYHHALLRHAGFRGPAAVLELGSVARLTWADARLADPAAAGACLAFDAGPGCDGAAGEEEAGTIDEAVLAGLLDLPLYHRLPPRRLEAPPDLAAATAGLGPADAAVTRAAVCAASVVQGFDLCPETPAAVLLCGPGRGNALVARMIAAGAQVPVLRFEERGLDGDLVRAQAAAYLAVRARRGLPTSAPGTTGVRAAVGGAEIATPGAEG